MSRFLNDASEYYSDNPTVVDFDDATKLLAAGSTCDIYRTRWQRREVFVKRLKEEYRAKPLYLDALDKEFEIGANLKHPSLPVYHAFERDYIIMDYIDGATLADMIRGKDKWLANEKNIVKLLRELIEVVGFLHRHNVVHCDIKADNIMITANNSNLVLIDFDKCYTDALNDTSGHPGKYGLSASDVGRSSIDFHAIGMLVEKLKKEVHGFKFGKYPRFVEACYEPDVNCEDLKDILAGPVSETSTNKLGVIVAAGMIIAGLLIGLIGYLVERNDKPDTLPVHGIAKELNSDTLILSSDEIEVEPTVKNLDNANADSKVKSAMADKKDESTQYPIARSQDEIHDDAKEKAVILDQKIQPSFTVLLNDLDRLNTLKNDSTLSGQQLLDNIRRHSDLADEYMAEAFEILNETFPGLTDREAWRIIAFSKAYTGYTRRATPELNEYGHEMERRFKAEGRTPQ
ncbi:MAG: protein kinase [Muribaculaceae bacterium]|nr:protein kinase [Muribaculaceae bacterium]